MPYKRPDSKYVQIRVGGVRQSSGTTDPEAASRLEEQLNLEIWKQQELGVKPSKSWKELCVRWKREKDGKATWSFDVRAIAFWGKTFENLPDVRRINREWVDEVACKEWPITKEPSQVNNTANHYVAVLSAMLNAACREWDWLERSPKFRRYPIFDGRKGWLTLEQWRAMDGVMASEEDYLIYRRAGTFDLGTGLRAAKVWRAEWSQFSFQDCFMTFDGKANKLGNTIPLNRTAMDVLREIKASKVVHPVRVFIKADGTPMQDWNDAWYTIVDRSGLVSTRDDPINGVCWHTFRHTWNSWLAQRGVSKEIRQRLGGWSAPSDNADRYTHLDIESLRPHAAVIDTIMARSEDRIVASA